MACPHDTGQSFAKRARLCIKAGVCAYLACASSYFFNSNQRGYCISRSIWRALPFRRMSGCRLAGVPAGKYCAKSAAMHAFMSLPKLFAPSETAAFVVPLPRRCGRSCQPAKACRSVCLFKGTHDVAKKLVNELTLNA